MPLFLDEWRPFRPRGAVEWVAWLAAKVGLVDPIPYQPIGGLARARGGFATPDAPLPIGAVFADARTDPEPFFLLQNLMLIGEALRLGGWVHGTPLIPGIWHREPGRLGLGFREHLAKPRRVAGAAGRRCRPRSRTTSASTACSRACARRT